MLRPQGILYLNSRRSTDQKIQNTNTVNVITYPKINEAEATESNPYRERSISPSDLGSEGRSRQVEILKQILKIKNNSGVEDGETIANATDLMELIQMCTDCDDVEIYPSEDVGCCGITLSSNTIVDIQRILCKTGEALEAFKNKDNASYNMIISNGISMNKVQT